MNDIYTLLSTLESPWTWIGFAILTIWSTIWKGLALWESARKTHQGWFVIILIVNTMGILEIIYLALQRSKKEGTMKSL